MTENFKFNQHKTCEFFPCHGGLKDEDFNCLFCYCPLYALKENCGGNFSYTEKGIKNCMDCVLPHGKTGYSHVMSKMGEIMELAKK